MDDSRRRTLRALAGLAGGLVLAGCTEQSSRDEAEDDEAEGDEAEDDSGTETLSTATTEEVPTGTPTESGTEPSPTATAEASPQSPTPTKSEPTMYDGYLDETDNFDGTVVDATGQSSVTVAVGAEGNNGTFAFDPPAVRVDVGTTVRWEWTSEGGAHSVVAEDGRFESEITEQATATYEHTFETVGVARYYCEPHRSLNMKGVVEVVDG